MAHMKNKHDTQVTTFLRNNGLNEHALEQDNYKDVAILHSVHTSDLFDYFTQADIGLYGSLHSIVNVKRRCLTDNHLQKLEQAITRAQRLKTRNLKRTGQQVGSKAYYEYKQQVDSILKR